MPVSLPARCQATRHWLGACVGVVALAGLGAWAIKTRPLPAAAPLAASQDDPAPLLPEVILELVNGQRFEGLLVRRDDREIVVRIGGIDQTHLTTDVSRVIELPTVRERYADLRRAIPDTDVEQLLVLVRWLVSRQELGLALIEIDQVLKQEPNHAEASRVKRRIEAELMLRAGQGEGQPREAPQRQEVFPILTPDEINLIKVFEVDLANPPDLELQRGAIDRLIDRYRDHDLMPKTPEGIEALKRWPARRVLDLMFRMQARDLYSQVIVRNHPESMRRFRDDIHNGWLIRSCATAACHGGNEAGRLFLRTTARGSDATIYTNFLILDRFRLADGTPLINYEHPENSPLLQMAIEPARSEMPHPPLPRGSGGWRPPISGPEDSRYKDAIGWIRSMYTPRPEYPIEYTPPRTKADGLPEETLRPAEGGPR